MTAPTPTLLLILDGWGQAPAGPGNAVSLSKTPNIDRLLGACPHALLKCSGRAVGLPSGFMGNSEVGHMNIGAGRVVYQDMTRIDIAIENGAFFKNPTLTTLLDAVAASKGKLHFLGLLSDGGVHSHVLHLHALLDMAKQRGVPAFVHAFLDGRDTPPSSGQGFVADLDGRLRERGVTGQAGGIASICGRYYAMDRDKRFERNALAYGALVRGEAELIPDPVTGVAQAYAAGETDEFVKPRLVTGKDGAPLATIRDGDGIFFFNFRADRARQIVQSLFDPAFAGFERGVVPKLAGFATMTEYDAHFGLPVAFAPHSVSEILAETVSKAGLRQLRIAETEKYAHVTYFFNCGREEPFPNEERALIPSPREVATYDLKPEMSVYKVTETLLEKWSSDTFDFVVCNLANLDMVGHTGVIPAAIKACEAVDECVGRIEAAVLARGGRMLMTADHGNAEEMLDADGNPQTAHSKNPVAFVLVERDAHDVPRQTPLKDGVLGDIAATILDLWAMDKPEEMSGASLLADRAQ
jgi:2,3-bisphosphoglycerate-independent phosphoglycerate mutase